MTFKPKTWHATRKPSQRHKAAQAALMRFQPREHPEHLCDEAFTPCASDAEFSGQRGDSDRGPTRRMARRLERQTVSAGPDSFRVCVLKPR